MEDQNIKKWITEYYDWLKSKTQVTNVGEWYEVSTPFLDRFNDGIVLYIKQNDDGKIYINDDGYTLDSLEASGYTLTKTRRNVLYKYLQNFGVSIIDNELSIIADQNNFPQKKHFLLQCILAVNDMFELSRNNVAAAYFEDVANYLDNKDVRYTANIFMQGKSGLTHHIDFVIAKSKNAPERILCAASKPNMQMIKMLMFALNDISEIRNEDFKRLVMLNDNKKISDDIINAFNAYNIKPYLWSERNNEKIVSELIA